MSSSDLTLILQVVQAIPQYRRPLSREHASTGNYDSTARRIEFPKWRLFCYCLMSPENVQSRPFDLKKTRYVEVRP